MANRAEASTPSPWKSAVDGQYETFLEQLSVKGRATVQKHDELSEADAAQTQGELWRRFAGGLGKLAGHATEVTGQHSVKFHIADGKYKQQVFALEDMRNGTIVVCLPDVLKLAMDQQILSPGNAPGSFKVPGDNGQLPLITMDAETRDLGISKAMVGWGRRALRVELSTQNSEKQLRAVEKMCALAAGKWAEAKV